jgi:hypothetical protein
MGSPSQPIAGDGVADRQREEEKRDGEQDDVQHGDAPGDGSAVRRITLGTRRRRTSRNAALDRARGLTRNHLSPIA